MRLSWGFSAGLIAALSILPGCSDHHLNPPPASTVTFAGAVNDGSKNIPCTWTGTTLTQLAGDGTHDAYALSPVVVIGGTNHVAGSWNDGQKDTACTWAGAARTDLAGGGGATDSSYALALAVSNGTVYTAGYYTNSNSNPPVELPCYWNGTTLVDLPCPANSTYGYGMGIAVSNGTVYTAGGYYDLNNQIYIPCLWTSTPGTPPTRTDLPFTSYVSGFATCLAVSGTTTYVGGVVTTANADLPCTWTGTTLTVLSYGGGTGGDVAAIALDGTTVYTTGDYYSTGGPSMACYWSGSTLGTLTGNGTYQAMGLALDVTGGVVTVGGYYYNGTSNVPCYWANGTRTDLQHIGGNNGSVIDGWWVWD
jgi:hypothetical protein